MALTRKASIITRILLGLDVVILCPLCFAIFWTSYPDRVVLGMVSSFWKWVLVLSYTAWQLPLLVLLIRALRRPRPTEAAVSGAG